jgi:hypothetical protein
MNSLTSNWLTTLGGILGGLPTIILGAAMASNFPLSNKEAFLLSIMGGIGTLLIGFTAKDFNTHSTNVQIAQSTAKVAEGELPKV